MLEAWEGRILEKLEHLSEDPACLPERLKTRMLEAWEQWIMEELEHLSEDPGCLLERLET